MCINVTVTSADLINFYSDMVWRQEGIQMSSVSDDKVTNEWVKKAIDLLQQYHGKLVATSCPAILCSALPTHHRSNKSLRNPFKVIVMDEVADGTTVTVKAGNDENPCAEIKNCTAVIKDQVAVFNDIRFIGRSGRGKTFNVSIIVNSNPVQIGTYNKAIKVTVDGPREPRSKNSFAYYPGQHPLLFNAYPMSHVAWLDPAYMNALSAEYLSNHLMAFSNQQSTSAPQFGFHNGYSQYTTAVFPGGIPPLNPSVRELRLPLPPPTIGEMSSQITHNFDGLSNAYVLPITTTSPISTINSDGTSETDDHTVHSSEDNNSIKSAFKQVTSLREERLQQERQTILGKRKNTSSSPTNVSSDSSNHSPNTQTDTHLKIKPKVWRPY